MTFVHAAVSFWIVSAKAAAVLATGIKPRSSTVLRTCGLASTAATSLCSLSITACGVPSPLEYFTSGSYSVSVGGASVRLPKLIGTARVMDMMLTGRTLSAEEGQAIGISQYLVKPKTGLAKAIELAKQIATNAPMTNFAIMHALPRIAESDPASGYVAEALMAAVAQGSDEAKSRLKDFLEKRGKKVLHK